MPLIIQCIQMVMRQVGAIRSQLIDDRYYLYYYKNYQFYLSEKDPDYRL